MGLIISRLNTLPTDVTNISVGSRIILPNGKEYILNNLKVWIPIHMMALEVKEDLTTENLNSISNLGIYHQNSNNNATLINNYPVESAGVLKVYVNNGNVFQEYQILSGQYNENQIYTRGKYAGYWSNWLKPNYVNINESDYNSLLSNKHNHSNKELLDSYTQTNENLLDAVNKKHLHSNINELNSINSTKINNWDIAYSWGNHNSFNYLTQTSGDIRYLKNTGYNDYDGSIRIVDTENEDTSYFVSGTSNAYITNNTINLSGFGLYSNLMNNLINNYWFGITEYAPMVPPNEIRFFEYDRTINRLTFGVDLPIYLNTLNLGTINQNKLLTLDNAGKIGYIDGIPVLKSDLLNNNIGIGTSTPTSKLHVNSGNSNGIRIDTDIDKTALSIGGTGKVEVDAPNIKGGRLIILDNGNVGMSTTAPSEKLEVTGNVKATGFKTTSGTSTQFLKADGSVDSNVYSINSHKHAFSTILLKPTTISGYGITDAFTKTETTNQIANPTSDVNISGGLIINGNLNSGTPNFAGYRQGGNNIVLKGNSTGVSGIFFQSEKDGTNINHPTDYGYIQFHAHGIDGTSGESNRLVIGVANDADDIVVIQSPYINGVKISYLNAGGGIGGTEYTVWHQGNDGSGSGLDADLLDGQESTYFLNTSSTTQTKSGSLVLTGNVTANSFTFLSDNIKTLPAIVGKFKTQTGGSNDFELIFDRSAVGTGAYYSIQSVEQGIAYNNLILQPHGGNLGIGTTSPSEKLEVNGGVSITNNNAINLKDSVSTNRRIILLSQSDTTYLGALDSGWGGETYISSPKNLTFRTNGSSSFITSMIITDTGNVGVGTTVPSQKLEVNGNVKATSFIKSGGTSEQFLKADGSVDGNSRTFNWENAIAIGFSSGEVPTNSGSQYPYIYHNNGGGAIALATQLYVINNYASKNSPIFNNKITIRDNAIEDNGTNDISSIAINYVGYNNGTAHYRNLDIYDGKANKVATFIGQNKSLNLIGNLIANSLIKSGGTSTQILMADGSIIEKSTIGDNQTLSTSIDNNGRYLSISGGNQISIDSRLIHVLDSPNRNPNDAIFYPYLTPKSVRFDFISAGHVSGTGNFAGVMTFSPWDGTTNSTGDSSYQLAFYNQTGINGSGIPGLKIRKGIDTTWNSWYKIYTDGDFAQSNIDNWNTAFGWGNHASAGYALANGTNATNNWGNTSSGLALNPKLSGKTLNASGQTVHLRDATYGQISGIVQDSTNGPIINDWTNRLKTLHNNSAGNFTELAQSFTGTEGVWHRRCDGGNISSWKRLYDDSIWNAASLSYSGSTLTLTINGISKTATINAGVGTTNYIPKFTASGTLGNSLIFDNGTNVGIGTTSPSVTLQVAGGDIAFPYGNAIRVSPENASLWSSGTTNLIKVFYNSNNQDEVDLYVPGSGRSTPVITYLSTGNVGIGTTSPTEKLEVIGNIKATGTINATSFYETSLRKYKTNIKKFDKSGIDLVDSLEIVTFDRIDSDVKSKIGIIADDTSDEFLSEQNDAIDLYKTIFIQSKAIQELNAKNLELEERLIKLEKLLSNG